MKMSTRRQGRFGAACVVMICVLFLTPATGLGQDRRCAGGWSASCASVEVGVAGDDLLFYVPNAALTDSSELDRAGVQLFSDLPGAVCDPTTGSGCAPVASDESGSDPGRFDPGGSDDQECVTYEEYQRQLAAGTEVSDRRVCRRAPPPAVLFMMAIPTTFALLAPDEGGTTVALPPADEPAPPPEEPEGEPTGDDDGSGDDDGADEGDGGGGEPGGGGGTPPPDTGPPGDGDPGDSDPGDGDSGDGDPGDGDPGDGDPGDGDPGDADPGDGDPGGTPPPRPPPPPVSQVPEPVSTTLFGIGLIGYAGVRLRDRRRQNESGPSSD